MDWVQWLIVGITATIIGAIIFFVVTDSDALSCPEGQHLVTTGYIPIQSGKTWIMVPQYDCQY